MSQFAHRQDNFQLTANAFCNHSEFGLKRKNYTNMITMNEMEQKLTQAMEMPMKVEKTTQQVNIDKRNIIIFGLFLIFENKIKSDK